MPVILAGTLACASSAFAAATPPMTVTVNQPSGAVNNFFELTAQPGQTTSAGSLQVRNQTSRRITVLLDPVRGLTASTLGSAYGLRSSSKKGAAKWVSLSTRKVVLAARQATRVPVSVSVPSGAEPGEYLAGIGVQSAAADEVRLKGNLAVSQVQRYAVGLVANLPGPRNPGIKLTGVGLDREPAGVTFKIRGRNSGNEILQNVSGEATISEGDEVVAERKLGPGTFVTDTSIAYPVLVPSLTPTQGTAFRVQALLRYKGGVARIDRVVRFGAIDAERQQQYGGPAVSDSDDGSNTLLILAVLAAIAGCLAALEWRRRRSGDGALRRVLPREIEHARASGEPLSVILVPADGGQRARDLAPAVQESLRTRDRLFRTKDTGLIVVARDTNPEAGEMLAAEIRRQVIRAGNGTAVIPVTSASDSSAEEIFEAAAASSESTAGNGDSGNGDAGNGHAPDTRVERGPHSEVRHGTEAPAVGGDDSSRRR